MLTSFSFSAAGQKQKVPSVSMKTCLPIRLPVAWRSDVVDVAVAAKFGTFEAASEGCAQCCRLPRDTLAHQITAQNR
jgi:hypothetical protein